jgi:hypothetical protein
MSQKEPAPPDVNVSEHPAECHRITSTPGYETALPPAISDPLTPLTAAPSTPHTSNLKPLPRQVDTFKFDLQYFTHINPIGEHNSRSHPPCLTTMDSHIMMQDWMATSVNSCKGWECTSDSLSPSKPKLV